MKFEIDEVHLSEPMKGHMRELIQRCKHAHHTDAKLRINGTYEQYEADWIKHLRELPEKRSE